MYHRGRLLLESRPGWNRLGGHRFFEGLVLRQAFGWRSGEVVHLLLGHIGALALGVFGVVFANSHELLLAFTYSWHRRLPLSFS